MVHDQQIVSFSSSSDPIRDHVYLRDWLLHPLPGGISMRSRLIRHAAETIHQVWRSGYDVRAFGPALWRFDLHGTQIQLIVPHHTLKRRITPLSHDQLTRTFALWREETRGWLDDAVARKFMVTFISREPLGPGRAASYLEEIETLARRMQPGRLRLSLARYAARSASPDAAISVAAYLSDRRIPVHPCSPTSVNQSADQWLLEAIARGDTWYDMAAQWRDLLTRLEALGFETVRKPLLAAIQMSRPTPDMGPWHVWINPSDVSPRSRHLFRRPVRSLDQLDREIHRIRQTGISPP